MLSQLKRLSSLSKSRSYLVKMFTLYFLLSVVIVLVPSYFVLRNSHKLLEAEIRRSNQYLLNQVKIYSDNYIIRKITSIINENFLTSTKINYISQFFKYINANQIDVLYNVSSDIVALENSNSDFLHSVYVYRIVDDILISSRNGIYFSFLSSQNSYRSQANARLVEKAMGMKDSKSWVIPLENEGFSKETPIISYIQSIPIYSNAENRDGFIIFNIDQQKYIDLVSKIHVAQNSELIIINGSGQLLSHSVKSKLFDKVDPEIPLDSVLNNDEGFKLINVDGNISGISWVKSSFPTSNWKYISLTPSYTLNRQLDLMWQFSIIVILATLLLSIIGILIITSRLYGPLNRLINSVKTRLNILPEKNGELSFINNVIFSLSDKVDEMKATLDKNKGLIEYKLVHSTLGGSTDTENALLERFSLIGIDYRHSVFGLLLIDLNGKVFMGLKFDEQEFIEYSLANIIKNFFKEPFVTTSISYSSGLIATIYNSEQPFEGEDTLRSLLNQIETELALKVNIIFSRPVDRLSSLSKVFTEIHPFIQYNFIYGFGNIFSPDRLQILEAGYMGSDPVDYDHMATLLKAVKIQEFKQALSEIREIILSRNYSFSQTQNLLLQTLNIISRTCQEQGISMDKISKTSILNDFSRIYSLDECIEWIYDLLDIYFQSIIQRNASLNDEYIKKIIQYIAANISGEITLNRVAEEFNISPGYLSKIFKEAAGFNFSDFVIKKKLEKAAALLIEAKSKSVEEIAEGLGYFNNSYFIQIFKSKYGMTPLQYRKKNTNLDHICQ